MIRAPILVRRALWTVTLQRATAASSSRSPATVLFSATGYYDYGGGHHADFEGREDFAGHGRPSAGWPEDLDYTGKKVVVIGSGATAVTLDSRDGRHAPRHVTMLQRSPTYVLSHSGQDPIANALQQAAAARTSPTASPAG